jgi:putative endonuclease
MSIGVNIWLGVPMAIGKVAGKMEYVYILQSEKNNRYYVGSTNDLVRRLSEHNSGHTESLKNLLPVKLVFSKEYSVKGEAGRMERHLKKLKSRAILEKIVIEKEIRTSFDR